MASESLKFCGEFQSNGTPSTEINYVPEKTSFLVTAKLSMAATAIDTDGIVDVVCDES